jgi:multidrug resistance efflux pump
MIKYALIAGCLTFAAFAVAVIDSKSPAFATVHHAPAASSSVRATGVVEGATRAIQLRPEVAGRVVELPVTQGQMVPAGAVLLRLDDQREKQLVEVSRASLELSRAKLQRLINGAKATERLEAKSLLDAKQVELNQAVRTWNRIRELHQQAAVSQQQADENEAAVKQLSAEAAAAKARWEQIDAPARPDEVREAQAGVAYAEAQLNLSQIALQKCVLRAPTQGKILDIGVEAGELLHPEAEIASIVMVDVSRLRVRAFVEEIDAPKLRVGMPATVTTDGLPGQTYTGKVSVVSPRMTAKHTFSGSANEVYDTMVREVLVDVPNAPELIGLRVDVNFPELETDEINDPELAGPS